MMGHGVRWAMLGVMAAAFGLRVYGAHTQSFWNDEILSLLTVDRGFPTMLTAGSMTVHPPLYFITLWAWRPLVGETEFALRMLSVVPSVAALSPFLVAYGQEARPYSLALALALASFYVGVKLWRGPSARWWLLWGCCALAAIAADYSALFVVAFEELVLLVGLWRRRLSLRGWLAGNSVLLLAAAWLVYNRPLGGIYGIAATKTQFAPYLWDVATAFAIGPSIDADWAATTIVALMWIAAAIGLVLPSEGRRPGATVLLLGYLVVPILLLFVLSMGRRDLFPRYVLVAAPAFYVLCAAGVARLGRRSRWLAAAAFLVFVTIGAQSLYNYYFEPRFWRDDFRAAGRWIAAQASDRDAIVFNASWGEPLFGYYIRRPLPSVGLPLAESGELQADATAARLAELTRSHYSIWLVLWQDYFTDPDMTVRAWLDANAALMETTPFKGVSLHRYRAAPAIAVKLPPDATPLAAMFGSDLVLAGYRLDTWELEQQARLHVNLFWRAASHLANDWRVHVALLNQAHYPFAQRDNRPVFDRFPTSAWPVLALIHDEYVLDVAAGTPPGYYYIGVEVYDAASGRRLPLVAAEPQQPIIGPFFLEPPNVAPSPAHVANVAFPGVATIVGYDVEGEASPGGKLNLTLFWRATDRTAVNYTVFNHVVDGAGRVWAQKDNQPVLNMYPTSLWSPGRYIRDPYEIQLPADMPAGDYRLTTGLYDAASGQRLVLPGSKDNAVELGPIRVKAARE